MSHAFRDGTRLGLLLQLAVGPVCLFVFRTGAERGVGPGLIAVAGVALVDALFIALAGLGVTRWAEGDSTRRALRYGGAAIVALFGADIVGSAAGVPLLPSLSSGVQAWRGSSSFAAALLLTASNPLTILFWAGVFGARIAAERYGRRDLWLFALGCVTATIAFLSATSVIGSLVGRMAPGFVLRALNVAVGVALIGFAVRLALHARRADR